MGKRGSRGMRWTTVDLTRGWGENAWGGRSKSLAAAQYVWTMIESRPQSGVHGNASILSANSLWYMSTASEKPVSRRRKVIFEDAE